MYMEEFLGLCHQMAWNDNTLKSCFWSGLNNHLLVIMPTGYNSCSLQQYIGYVLWLVGSPMMVGIVEVDFDTTNSVSTPHILRLIHPEDIPKPLTRPSSDQKPKPKPPANPEPESTSAMDFPVEKNVIPELEPKPILDQGPESRGPRTKSLRAKSVSTSTSRIGMPYP